MSKIWHLYALLIDARMHEIIFMECSLSLFHIHFHIRTYIVNVSFFYAFSYSVHIFCHIAIVEMTVLAMAVLFWIGTTITWVRWAILMPFHIHNHINDLMQFPVLICQTIRSILSKSPVRLLFKRYIICCSFLVFIFCIDIYIYGFITLIVVLCSGIWFVRKASGVPPLRQQFHSVNFWAQLHLVFYRINTVEKHAL